MSAVGAGFLISLLATVSSEAVSLTRLSWGMFVIEPQRKVPPHCRWSGSPAAEIAKISSAERYLKKCIVDGRISKLLLDLSIMKQFKGERLDQENVGRRCLRMLKLMCHPGHYILLR